jgi:5-methylcytosine-specific restriction enzyme subunit McrC
MPVDLSGKRLHQPLPASELSRDKPMAGISLHEFDTVIALTPGNADASSQPAVPPAVFDRLERQALRVADAGESAWLRLTQRRGGRAVRVSSFVGVIRAPDGYEIEVLSKVRREIERGHARARKLLIEMLRCLGGFRNVQTDSATLMATRMPLFEVFIGAFLLVVEQGAKNQAVDGRICQLSGGGSRSRCGSHRRRI